MADTETTTEATPTTTPKTEVYPDLMDGEDPEGVDYDLEQLKLAEAEAEAEESGQPPSQPGAAPAEPAAPSATPAPAEPPPDPADQQMVPHGRFHAVNERLKETERALAFREGQLATLQQQPAQQPAEQPPAEPPPDFDAKREEIRAKHREVARRYDSGEITMEDVEDSRFRTDQELGEVDRVAREAEAAAAAPAGQPAHQPLSAGEAAKVIVQELGGHARLNSDAKSVILRHPYLAAVPAADMPFYQQTVVRELEAAGTPIIFDNSFAQTQRLREAIGAKLDVLGPVMYPQFDPKTVSQSPSPAPGNQPAPASQAKARQDKLTMAANHPPDVSQVGSQGGHVEVNDQQIEGMTDDEIAALPAAVQDKIAL